MKTWTKTSTMLMAMLAMALSVSIANAADAPAKAAKKAWIRGEITKIDGANVTVQPATTKKDTTAKDPVTFATTADTVVTINSEKKAVTDLKVGDKVSVTLDADGKNATAITEGGMGKHKNAK